MPKSTRILPRATRDLLRDAVERLGLSQLGLAKDAGASQGFVSNLLTGKKPIRNRDLVDAVATVLQKKLAANVQARMIDRIGAVEIQRGLDELRVRFELAKREHKSLPGGAVARDAVNYVDRLVDHNGWPMSTSESVKEILRELPLSMVVYGPVHSGKTTYVKALERELVAAGAKVVSLDANLASSEDENSPSAVAASVFRQLSRLTKDEWGLKGDIPGNEDVVVSFVPWLEDQLRGTAADDRFITIDNVSSLSAEAATGVQRVLRVLHNERAVTPSLPAICIAMAFLSVATKSILESSMTAFNTRIEVGWFEENEEHHEVQALAGKLEPDRLPEFVGAVYDYFRGQPFATDVALRLLEKGADVEQVQASAAKGAGAFAQHEHYLRKVLQEGRSGLHVVSQRANELGSRRPDIEYLRNAKIIDIFEGAFVYASPYYAAAIPRLLNELEALEPAEGDGGGAA